MGEDGGYIGCHRTTVVGELLAGCGLGGVVVVSGETHLDFACRQTIVLGFISLDEVGNGSTLPYLHQFVLIVPAVVHVEAAHGEVVGTLTLGQHYDLAVAGSGA